MTPAAAGAEITQPPQPKSGPGGSAYKHRGVQIQAGGAGADAWFVFQPAQPWPQRAPLAIVMHGYGEFSGYDTQAALIGHTVRKGSVVIYPRWQTGISSPCPGPFDIEPCIASAVNAIRGALSYLRESPTRVQPRLRRTSYFGFSFGGIVTTNMLNRYKDLGLPKPRAVLLDDPHDGALDEINESALDDSLAGIPSTTLFQCHSGADGVLNDPYLGVGSPLQTGRPQKDSSCKALVPKLTSIPARNKDLVITHTDGHGQPALSSDHGVCTAAVGQADAYDWNFCWKVWDALRSCAYSGKDCAYALGNTARHRSHGRWSDGTRVATLEVRP